MAQSAAPKLPTHRNASAPTPHPSPTTRSRASRARKASATQPKRGGTTSPLRGARSMTVPIWVAVSPRALKRMGRKGMTAPMPPNVKK
jgi:hypothetical protein